MKTKSKATSSPNRDQERARTNAVPDAQEEAVACQQQPAIRWVKPDEIVCSIFDKFLVPDPMADEILLEIMKRWGFDPGQPLVCWEDGQELLLVDGHRRLAAAKAVGQNMVPVICRQFTDDREAALHVLTSALSRRRISEHDWELLTLEADQLRADMGDSLGSMLYVDIPAEKTEKPVSNSKQANPVSLLESLRAALADVRLAESHLVDTKPQRAELYPIRTSIKALEMGIRDLVEFGRPMPPASYTGRTASMEDMQG